MTHALQLTAALLLAPTAWSAWAADPPKPNLPDDSAQALISSEVAKQLMADTLSARVRTLCPASRYSFVSQVEGGITGGGACVVTARVMLLPLTPTAKAVLMRPQKTATASTRCPARPPRSARRWRRTS